MISILNCIRYFYLMKKEYIPSTETSKVEEPAMAFTSISSVNPAALIGLVSRFESPSSHLQFLKDKTGATDDTIASWLNVNVKTYRSYRGKGVTLKPDVKEHLIILTAVVNHGLNVIGSEGFGKWLHTDNFMLGGQKPSDLFNTNSGVRLVDDRLTGIEYGDNA